MKPSKIESAFALRQFENWIASKIVDRLAQARKECQIVVIKNSPLEVGPAFREARLQKIKLLQKEIMKNAFAEIKALAKSELIKLGLAVSEFQVKEVEEQIEEAVNAQP